MKYLLAIISILFVLPALAESLSPGRAADVKEAIGRFNEFGESQGPVVDCQEAVENPDLVNDCRVVGIQKVKQQARAWGYTIRDTDVYACDVDNSHWVFSNYVWFCADTPKGKISKMTQKPRFRACF